MILKFLKSILIVSILTLFAFSGAHKYYISITEINYVLEKESIQITSRIFIDDLENVLRKRYNKDITLAEKNELTKVDSLLEQYLKKKILIKINNKQANIVFIGKEYETDIMLCYLEIEDVKSIESFELSNKILFDLFEDQQNITKIKINSSKKSVIQNIQDNNTLLTFN